MFCLLSTPSAVIVACSQVTGVVVAVADIDIDGLVTKVIAFVYLLASPVSVIFRAKWLRYVPRNIATAKYCYRSTFRLGLLVVQVITREL